MSSQQPSGPDFDNFLLAIRSNVPMAGYVKPNLLKHDVYVAVLAEFPSPRMVLARHYFFNPEDPNEEWPSFLVFNDEDEAKNYASSSDGVIAIREIEFGNLMKITENVPEGTCGVMFRTGGLETHIGPQQVKDFNRYARLGGITLITDSASFNLEEVDGLVLTKEQLEKFDELFRESPFIESYTIWKSDIKGIDTTVIEVEFKNGITLEQAVPEHKRLLASAQEISSDVTLLAVPYRNQQPRQTPGISGREL